MKLTTIIYKSGKKEEKETETKEILKKNANKIDVYKD